MKKQFAVGDKFHIINYENDQHLDLEILSRNERWATVLLGDKQIQVRLYKVSNPFSESILLDGYSPVFSYNFMNTDDIKDDTDYDE